MSKKLRVQFTDTLMRLDNELEIHVQSGDRTCTYYFQVPDSWAAVGDTDMQTRVFAVAQKIYQDFNAHFRAVEPDDYSYLLVKATTATVLTSAEEQGAPWLQARNPAVWEWTPCVVVHDDGSYTKVDRDRF